MKLLDLLTYISLQHKIKLILSRIYLSAFNVIVSLLIQLGISSVMTRQNLMTLFFISLGLVGGSILYIFVYFYHHYLLQQFFQNFSLEMGERLVNSILSHGVDKHVAEGELLTLIHEDIDTVSNFVQYGFIPFVDMLLTIIVGCFYISVISFPVTVIFCFAGLILAVINYFLSNKMDAAYDQYMVEAENQNNFYEQVTRSVPIIKVFNLKNWLEKQQDKHIEQRRKIYQEFNKAYATSISLTEGGIILVEAAGLIVGLVFVVNGYFSLGALVGAWNAGLGSILYPCADLPHIYQYFIQYKTSLSRLNNLLNQSNPDINFEKKGKQVSVTFRNISLKNEEKVIFKNFNATIPSKGITFIIGKSGSGKSTLFNLIMQEILPDSGYVLFNGEQSDLSDSDTISLVPQVNMMFNTTIRDNLVMGDTAFSDKDLEKVCRKLNIWDVISSLPGGLDTNYGDDIQLSNGQLRRIGIARAVVAENKIILLDEPFSDLDLDNQKIVFDYLKEQSQNKAVVIISHTMDFINQAEHIIKVGESDDIQD